MSHHVYTTRGVVLGSMPLREADKLVLILTRDLGLVVATARGIRNHNSKLRPILDDLSIVKVSLVKTLQGWRVTTAELIKSFQMGPRASRPLIKSLNQIIRLLRKLVKGEEKSIKLFEDLERDMLELVEDTKINAEDWEIRTVSRMLCNLGYFENKFVPQSYNDVALNKKALIRLINDGLHSSGLHNV